MALNISGHLPATLMQWLGYTRPPLQLHQIVMSTRKFSEGLWHQCLQKVQLSIAMWPSYPIFCACLIWTDHWITQWTCHQIRHVPQNSYKSLFYRTRLCGFILFHLILDTAFNVHSKQIQPHGLYSDEVCHETVISWGKLDMFNNNGCCSKANSSFLDLEPYVL